ELQRPRARPLQVQLIVRFRDRIRREHRIRPALRHAAARPVAFDLPIDEDTRYVYALRLELASHALRERAQAELANREIMKIRATRQRRGRAGEDDRAGVAPCGLKGEHRAHGLAPDQEAAETRVFPVALELLSRCIEYALAHRAAGVVDDEPRRAEL